LVTTSDGILERPSPHTVQETRRFGKPEAGTLLVLAAPRSAIDLPLKVLVRENAMGEVWVSTHSAAHLLERYGLSLEHLPTFAVVEAIVAAATSKKS
jgi:uncharacterized protein (DUF302 family)